MNETKIDDSIDFRYESDVEEAFNKFIRKWCIPSLVPHLIDDDDNDGQFMRDKISALTKQRRELVEKLDWDSIKEIISDHTNRAYRDFSEDYFEHGTMRNVGVVSDNIIEEIKVLLTEGE